MPARTFSVPEWGALSKRWVAEPEPALRVRRGEEVVLPTLDGFDGQLTPESTHADVLALDLTRSHPLSGPIWVEGAGPGDTLSVEFLEYETAHFGITAQIPSVGLLADRFPEPFLLTWSIENGLARASELPGVAVPARTFAGVVGAAPSHDMLRRWLERESGATDATGVSTVPPRELGGNVDIPCLTAGSRLFLPVACPGGLVSIGDVHFAQGEGEVCGTAIEVAGSVRVRFDVIRSGWQPTAPCYSTPPRLSPPTFATTGISIGSDLRDIYLAAQNAVGEVVDYLCWRHGFARQAAYALASATVDVHVSELVNAPHCLVSALLPLNIFEDEQLWAERSR